MKNKKKLSDLEIGKRIIEFEARALLNFSETLNKDFSRAVEIILKTKGKVIVIGMGKSGHVGKKIAATLSSVGTSSFFVHPGEALHGDLGMIQKNDVLILISNSGNSSEIKSIMSSLKKIGPKMIAITKNQDSFLGKISDVSLILHYEKEACPHNLAPTVSSTMTLALGDAIAIALMKRKKFSRENYGVFHPGGELGKESVKINELIPKKSLYSCVEGNEDLLTVVKKMLSINLGLIAVVNKKNRVLGVISDGDLKRYISKHGENFLKKKAFELMSKNPIIISKNDSIADSIKKMNENKVSVLVVSGVKRNFEGLITRYDLN